MTNKDKDGVIAEIEALEKIYLQCRAVFPALSDSIIGHNEFTTAPYYLKRGFLAHVRLGSPITKEFIEQNSKLVKWVNENALIRLYGIMNHHGFYDEIDHNRKGSEEVDILRRMRNIFTKTVLNYKPEDSENVRLREKVIAHFKLKKEDYKDGSIPTPIDTVVGKIFRSCKEYIKEQIA